MGYPEKRSVCESKDKPEPADPCASLECGVFHSDQKTELGGSWRFLEYSLFSCGLYNKYFSSFLRQMRV